MIIAGDQWPVFLYHGYNYDPQDPWNGLFRSALLVVVNFALIFQYIHYDPLTGIQTYLHITKFC